MAREEVTLDSKLLYEGKIVRLRLDTVQLENGAEAKREVVDHPGGVAVLALTEEGKVSMVRQYRYPFSSELLEIPAGKLEYGEDPLTCGKRELQEETGLVADCYYDLGKVYPTVGYVSEVIHCYLATGLRQGALNLDEDEFLDVEQWALADLYQAVLDGDIRDSKTQVMILKAYAFWQGTADFPKV